MPSPSQKHPHPGIMYSPTFLLLATGTLVGFNFPLGKIAGNTGVSPVVWAMITSLGASGFLFPFLVFKRNLEIPKGKTLRYIIVSALISFVTPNLLLFSVIPKVGAGYAGLMFALSPVFTLTLAVAFKLQTPNRIGIMGIALGLAGAVVVNLSRITAPDAPPIIWMVAALMIPAVLACGNIYRTMDWPESALPDGLAFWSHSFSVIVFWVILIATKALSSVADLKLVPLAALAQMLVAGFTFPVYFRLQQRGGPVLLSQIGYVASAVGLLAATFLLGERYRTMTWFGATIIACGIAITVTAQIKARQSVDR